MGSLIHIISSLVSESCLSNCKTLSNYPEPPNESDSPSERSHYPALRRKSHRHRESRLPQPKIEVADLDLEATGLETGPDLQAGPGLKLA